MIEKYFYISKEKAKRGEALIFACEDKKIENFEGFFNERALEVKTTNIPFFITYEENTGEIREATLNEQVERGHLKLEDNQIIIDNKVVNVSELEEIKEGKIVNKSREQLINDNLISLESEKAKARRKRKEEFKALDILNIQRSINWEILTQEEEEEIKQWYQIWLELPNEYEDLTRGIEEGYPQTPLRVQKFK